MQSLTIHAAIIALMIIRREHTPAVVMIQEAIIPVIILALIIPVHHVPLQIQLLHQIQPILQIQPLLRTLPHVGHVIHLSIQVGLEMPGVILNAGRLPVREVVIPMLASRPQLLLQPIHQIQPVALLQLHLQAQVPVPKITAPPASMILPGLADGMGHHVKAVAISVPEVQHGIGQVARTMSARPVPAIASLNMVFSAVPAELFPAAVAYPNVQTAHAKPAVRVQLQLLPVAQVKFVRQIQFNMSAALPPVHTNKPNPILTTYSNSETIVL